MKYLTKNKVWDIIEEYNIDKLLYLLIDRPNKINCWNELIWRNRNNQIHRNYDLPAEIWLNGHLIWLKNGKRHRINKPAILQIDGYKHYYVNGEFIKEER